MPLEFQPVSFSRTSISELMIPSYANFGGKVHGGIILSLMDKAAYACASKHSRAYCVTVSVDTVNFLEAIEVGELVTLNASVNYVGKTSLVIGIQVVSEKFKEGTSKHTNTSFFTMVAMSDGKPVEVPGLIIENKEELRRFLEAMKRKEFKQSYSAELKKAKGAIDIEKEMNHLQNEKCRIEIKL